jgi:putative aldouronate transport system permease protein
VKTTSCDVCAASIAKKKVPRLITRFSTYKYYYLLLLPMLAWFVIFCYFPMYGVVIGFKDYNIRLGIFGSAWADPVFKYFNQLFSSTAFRQSFWNTIVISALKMIFGFPAPIIFALFLNELRGKYFKKTVQTLSYLPYFISWVILGGILRDLLSATGPINYLVQLFGRSPVLFLGDTSTFRSVIVITYIWQSIGWSSIIYLAAIASIDAEQYEAAMMDGATRLGMMWRITLPSIRPTISILFILSMGTLLSAGFDQVFNLYSGAVYSVGDILDTYIYRVGLQNFDYSLSTALSLVKNIIGLALVLISNFVAVRIGGKENALW